MDKSLLTKLIGFPATLIHYDTLVLDRWLWLKARLPVTRNEETLIDIGCGTGAFTIGAARRGYKALGLSWDERNQRIAAQRAKICKAGHAKFEILDIRTLDSREDLVERFDVAVCFETIEHIIDDRKLFRDMAACLKPGGRLLLTTPYLLYRPITAEDCGPFLKTEEGWHVRRGYTKAMLEELCKDSGLIPESISYCSGILSQKITTVLRFLTRINPIFAWLIVLPFRIFPPVFDKLITPIFQWPSFSICLEAYKPRFRKTQKDGLSRDL